LYAIECTGRELDIKKVKNPENGELLDESRVRESFDKLGAELSCTFDRVVAQAGSCTAMHDELRKTIKRSIGMEELSLTRLNSQQVARGAVRPECRKYTCMGCNRHCDENLCGYNFFGKNTLCVHNTFPFPFENYINLEGDYCKYLQQYNCVIQDADPDSPYMRHSASTGVSREFNNQDGGIWALGPCCSAHAKLAFFLSSFVPRLVAKADKAFVKRKEQGETCSDDQLYFSTERNAEIMLDLLTRATEEATKEQISWPDVFDGDDEKFWDAVHEIQNVRFKPGTNEAVFGSRDLVERGRLGYSGYERFEFERSKPEMPWMRRGSSAKRPAREDDEYSGSSSKTPRRGGAGLIPRMQVVEDHLRTGCIYLADQISAANKLLDLAPSAGFSFPEHVAAIEEALGIDTGAQEC
jgi:hypothetical protein